MRSRKWLITLLLAGAVMLMGGFIFRLAQLPADPPLPSPNGYEDFIQAGRMIAANTSDYNELGDEQLRRLVSQNEEALRLARTGLSRESRVPVVYTLEALNGHVSELSSIKSVAQALAAEGRLAEREGRNGEAASVYLETIRLGQEVMRGGVIIDGLVGLACEAIGLTGLPTVLTNLDAITCRKLIAAWESFEKKPESFEEVIANEQVWARRSYPFYYRPIMSLMRLFNVGSIRQAEQRMLQKFQAQETRRRDLLIALATRAYELETGQPPKNVAELVPGYIQAIPNDPTDGDSP